MQGVVTYCCFDEIEILQFCFFMFDREKNGYIDQDELKFFVDTLHNEQQVANVRTAFQAIKFQKDGKFDFPELQKLNKDFPTVLCEWGGVGLRERVQEQERERERE